MKAYNSETFKDLVVLDVREHEENKFSFIFKDKTTGKRSRLTLNYQSNSYAVEGDWNLVVKGDMITYSYLIAENLKVFSEKDDFCYSLREIHEI